MKTIFLKLGGSLITDKDKPFTARLNVINSIGRQIKNALEEDRQIRLLIGHGSGSFGHAAAKAAGYDESGETTVSPHSLQTIWTAAHKLDDIILNEFNQLGLPVWSFPPSASIQSSGKKIINWDIAPIELALEQGLIPLIYGDIVLDRKIGGVIYSTEDLFLYLSKLVNPDRILLAGKEAGVWSDFPDKKQLFSELTDEYFSNPESSILASESIDVTGGMLKKVQIMLRIKEFLPETQITIFSGEEPDSIKRSLAGEIFGTQIK